MNFTDLPHEPVNTLECDCKTTGTAKCPAGAGGPRPSEWVSFTGDRLQNLTGRNMNDYLLKTYGKYIKRRLVCHLTSDSCLICLVLDLLGTLNSLLVVLVVA